MGPDMMDVHQQTYMGHHHHHGYHPPQQQQQQQQQQYGHYGNWNNQGGWSSGINPGIPGVDCTDADIIISTGLEHSRTREANIEYQRLLLANTVLFGSLPTHYQGVHAQHIYHFLTHVRRRRFLQCIAPNVYVPFNNGPFQIAQEITGDPCKMAFQNRNPLWLLEGLQLFTASPDSPSEQTWIHRSNPRGNEWEAVSIDQVQDILKEEGPVHLLLLPEGIEIKPALDGDQQAQRVGNTDENTPAVTKESHHHKVEGNAVAPKEQPSDRAPADEEDDNEENRKDNREHTVPDITDDNIIEVAEQAVEEAATMENVDVDQSSHAQHLEEAGQGPPDRLPPPGVDETLENENHLQREAMKRSQPSSHPDDDMIEAAKRVRN